MMPVRGRSQSKAGVEAIVSAMDPFRKARRMLEVVTRRKWSMTRAKKKGRMMRTQNRSTRALEYALSLAKEADADLILLHVLEAVVEEAGDMAAFALSEYRDFLKRNALERLEQAVPAAAREWCRPASLVVSGRSYRQILSVAKKQDADLIVMGVQGRNAVDLALFGSTTHHVVREAKCPVLTIRSQ